MGRPIIDLTGQRFGKLTVLYRAADHVQPSGQHMRVWHCKCNCGNECDVRSDSLKHKKINCGCSHGLAKTQDEFIKELYAVNPNITVLGTYVKYLVPVQVSCNICGYVWAPIPMSLFQGHGCPKCNVGNAPKKVICVETGIVYNSVTKASKATNISDSSIRGCCYGRRKTAGGYHWKFVDEQ